MKIKTVCVKILSLVITNALKYVCKVLAEKHQKAVIIGREKYRESLCSDIPDLVKFEWIDSPADNDVLEAL